MFTLTEKGNMTDEMRTKIVAMLEVDKEFRDYSIEVKPVDAIAFAQFSVKAGQPDEMLFKLLTVLEANIPQANRGEGHPKTGRSTHAYRLGRQVGKRVLFLELHKTDYPSDLDLPALLEQLSLFAKEYGALCEASGDQHGWAVEFLWV